IRPLVDRVHRETARARGRLGVADGNLADDRLRGARGEGGVRSSAAAGADQGTGDDGRCEGEEGGSWLHADHDTTPPDRKSTRLNSSHVAISYAVFCLK